MRLQRRRYNAAASVLLVETSERVIKIRGRFGVQRSSIRAAG